MENAPLCMSTCAYVVIGEIIAAIVTANFSLFYCWIIDA